MQLHKLTIVCDGSRSPSGRPDPADISELAVGAELLLAANAYFYTEGRVPRDGHPGTGYFSIGGGSSRDEPHAYEAWVRVLSSEVYDPATYTFRDQLLGSITAWERGDLLHHPRSSPGPTPTCRAPSTALSGNVKPRFGPRFSASRSAPRTPWTCWHGVRREEAALCA